jgi:hypothetical protein
MKKFMVVLSLFFVGSVACASPPIVINNKISSYTNMVTSSDQERCQAEANYMAANNISGHVWGVIGRFEGVGYGNSPNCNTCTPSSNMRLTGDASAMGRNGKWYRVRSWR